jgi:hypothetical protein
LQNRKYRIGRGSLYKIFYWTSARGEQFRAELSSINKVSLVKLITPFINSESRVYIGFTNAAPDENKII